MSASQVLAVFAAIWSTISAQIQIPGTCAHHTVVNNFNLDSYLGTWYEIENTFAAYEGNGTCIQANYSDFGNGSIRVLNSRVTETGEIGSTLGSARLADPSGNEAKLLVNFPSMGSLEGPYWVLDTDYTSYSIVWSCRPTQDGINSLQTFWFLSRTRNAADFHRGYVHGYLTALNFDTNNMEETIQTNCPDINNLNNLID